MRASSPVTQTELYAKIIRPFNESHYCKSTVVTYIVTRASAYVYVNELIIQWSTSIYESLTAIFR